MKHIHSQTDSGVANLLAMNHCVTELIATRQAPEQQHDKTGQHKHFIDEPVCLPEIPVRLLKEQYKLGHNDCDLNHRNPDSEPPEITRLLIKRPCKP